MPSTLINRYTYGNFVDLPAQSREADFFLGGPARQRELIALTETQIAAQREAAAEISTSNITAATLICSELQESTDRLESALAAGVDTVRTALYDIGDRLEGELVELRWEIAQLTAVSEQVLEVLKRPRSTEAQELIQQGIRNLVNDKIEQAAERFHLALGLDNTDYQVLMNLSSVELRKGNAAGALEYVRDALTLPATIDTKAKGDALWSLARIHYAAEDYGAASAAARQSLQLVSTPRRLLQLGIYCVLADRLEDGLGLIEESITQEPSLFAIAASTRDLRAHRAPVRTLLGRLAMQVRARLTEGLAALAASRQSIHNLEFLEPSYKQQFLEIHESLQQLANGASYTTCLEAVPRVLALAEAPRLLADLDEAEKRVATGESNNTLVLEELRDASLRVKTLASSVVPTVIASFVVALVLTIVILEVIDKPGNTVAGMTALLPWIAFGVLVVWKRSRVPQAERALKERTRAGETVAKTLAYDSYARDAAASKAYKCLATARSGRATHNPRRAE